MAADISVAAGKVNWSKRWGESESYFRDIVSAAATAGSKRHREGDINDRLIIAISDRLQLSLNPVPMALDGKYIDIRDL